MPDRTTAYLDCSSGISGDMLFGALVDAGVPVRHFREALASVPVTGYRLRRRTVHRCGVLASKVDVILDGSRQEARSWKEVRRIIAGSDLDRATKGRALELFRRLFVAEAAVHGGTPDSVHLHELGAVDCIVDILTALIGTAFLGIDEIIASPVNLGTGHVTTAHGTLPVPAPATIELLKGVPVYASASGYELTTPTGALLVSSLASTFGPMPLMRVRATGYGAGAKDLPSAPNVIRLFLGDRDRTAEEGRVVVIETNIDDMNPQFYDHVMARLFEAGALDVFMTPVMMKKNRPGIVLSVIAEEDGLTRAIGVIQRETTSIGVRFSRQERAVLRRESLRLRTRFGQVRFKKVIVGPKETRLHPEYDDCKRIASRTGLPIGKVAAVLRREAGEGDID